MYNRICGSAAAIGFEDEHQKNLGGGAYRNTYTSNAITTRRTCVEHAHNVCNSVLALELISNVHWERARASDRKKWGPD